MFAPAIEGEQGVLEAYLRAIHMAERFIYIENQYFNNDTITQALIDALAAKPGLRLILLVNVTPDMPLYSRWQQDAIRRIFIRSAHVEDAGRRLHQATTPRPTPTIETAAARQHLHTKSR
jgi:phosphatidylserine/phosphatidylglycerophosphate/cardiolipin synthase-like enzyme